MHFTSRMLNELEAGDRRFELRERGGLTIRVTPTGRKVWSLVWRRFGKLARVTLGEFPEMSLADARQESRRLRSQSSPSAPADPAGAMTWNELAALWSERGKDTTSDLRRAEGAMLRNRVLPLWGHRPASSIRQSEITRFVSEVGADTPVTASRLLKLIRNIYAFGIDNGLLNEDPTRRADTPARRRSRQRILSPDEINRFWYGVGKIPCQPGTRLALKMLLITGFRVGEICAMRWEHMDLHAGIWQANMSGPKIRLSPLAVKILGAARSLSHHSEWVFPGTTPRRCLTTNALGNALRRNRPSLQLAPFSPDDLRRSAAEALQNPVQWAERLLIMIREPLAAIPAEIRSEAQANQDLKPNG